MQRVITRRILAVANKAAGCLALAAMLNTNKAYSAPSVAPAKTPAGKAPTNSAPAISIALTPPPTNIFVSTFSTDNPRDPFHPQNKPKTASATVLTGAPSETEQGAVATAVQAGFQGIYGSGEDRELLVYGMLLRENKETVVTVPMNGQRRKLKVKALKIYRNAAELQVEGVPQPITVPKPRS